MIQTSLKDRVHLADGDRRIHVSAGNDYHVENDAATESTLVAVGGTRVVDRLNADIVESHVC